MRVISVSDIFGAARDNSLGSFAPVEHWEGSIGQLDDLADGSGTPLEDRADGSIPRLNVVEEVAYLPPVKRRFTKGRRVA